MLVTLLEASDDAAGNVPERQPSFGPCRTPAYRGGVGPPRTLVIDRAGADDVLQLAVDRGRVPMAIGALHVLDPDSRPAADDVRARVASFASVCDKAFQTAALPIAGWWRRRR